MLNNTSEFDLKSFSGCRIIESKLSLRGIFYSNALYGILMSKCVVRVSIRRLCVIKFSDFCTVTIFTQSDKKLLS